MAFVVAPNPASERKPALFLQNARQRFQGTALSESMNNDSDILTRNMLLE
jgi:hypothetical protein